MRALSLFIAILAVSPALANDCKVRGQIRADVSAMFWEGDVEALDARAGELRERQPRTPSGLLFSGQFYAAIRESMPENPSDDEVWDRAHATADAWIAAFPNSPAGYIAKANIHYQRGLAYRQQGGGPLEHLFPDLYRHQQWKTAHDLLDDNHAIAATDPEYYSVLLNVHKWRDESRPVFRAALDEALGRFPDYDEIYFRAASYYSPLFCGSNEEVEALAQEAVRRTERLRGHELYVRTLWAAPHGTLRSPFVVAADAEMFHRGMADLLEDYPAQWNIRHLIFFARIRSEIELMTELSRMVDGTPMTNADGFLACP